MGRDENKGRIRRPAAHIRVTPATPTALCTVFAGLVPAIPRPLWHLIAVRGTAEPPANCCNPHSRIFV